MAQLRFCNKMGFPCIESTSASLTTTAETFSFNKHPFIQNYFYGGLYIKISGTQTAPTTAVPIQFTTQGVDNSTVAVLNSHGVAYTTATWPGDGIYLGFYDKDANKLQLLTV